MTVITMVRPIGAQRCEPLAFPQAIEPVAPPGAVVAQAVVALTPSMFDATVFDPSKAVMVEFYAPWRVCGLQRVSFATHSLT